jgi:hypothetical protein
MLGRNQGRENLIGTNSAKTGQPIQEDLLLVADLGLLREMSDDAFSRNAVHEAVIAYAEKEGKGNVLWPMRMALSGKDRSPDPFVLAEALGRIETIARIEAAVDACT